MYISEENIVALLTANSSFLIIDSKIVVVNVNIIDLFSAFLSCSLLYRFSVILNTEKGEFTMSFTISLIKI